MGDLGAMELAKGLKDNKSLVLLKLDSNSIEDEGGETIAEALDTNSTLKDLDIESMAKLDNSLVLYHFFFKKENKINVMVMNKIRNSLNEDFVEIAKKNDGKIILECK